MTNYAQRHNSYLYHNTPTILIPISCCQW